jgi:hypothetical protein
LRDILFGKASFLVWLSHKGIAEAGLGFLQSRRTKKLAAEKAVAPLGGEEVVLRGL